VNVAFQNLAQIVSENSSALLTYGPMGVILAWFMWRSERMTDKLADLAHRIDGLTKALLVDMVERESSGDATKRFARDAISRIDARIAKEDRKR